MKKILISMLALLLAMGGAWAQGPTQVTQITTDLLPASWQDDYDHDVTLADLQALGFVAVDVSVAQAWTGAPQNDYAWLIYGFNEGNGSFSNIMFDNGNAGNPSYSSYTKGYLYGLVANGTKYFYTGSPEPAAIKLTPDATGKVWTLAETPDYDLDLNVVYYQNYALKEIPTNWQVKVDGVDKTAAIDHDSLMIVETAQVILTPDHPERVKKVILVDEVVLVNIDGITLDITGCTTWAQIIARNPGVIWDFNGLVDCGRGMLYGGSGNVNTSDTYNPSENYEWLQ